MPLCEMPAPIPIVACCIDDEEGCACGLTERALRAGAALTAEQREWCLHEIGSIEGHTREDHEGSNDADLCRAVLSAWTDYCRDKGLM